MKRKTIKIENAEVSCNFAASNPDGPDEYEVKIKVANLLYCIYTLAEPFEKEDSICHRVYNEWKNGCHNDVIAEKITNY